MPQRLFDSFDYPAVPTTDGALYPVHRIFCVGRNYAEHAKEMGVEVDREAPFYFLKNAQAIVATGAAIPYPPGTENFHYEMELVMAALTPAATFGTLGPQRITLSVNGETKQDAYLSDLVWTPTEIIAHLSRFYHLAPGDLIYTGTPAGVGPVVAGDVIHGEIDGLAPVDLVIGVAQ